MKEKIVISVLGSARIIDITDVIYFEALSGRVCVHFSCEGKIKKMDFDSSLKELESSLKDKGFVRIHKSILVPQDKITEIGAGYVRLKGMEQNKLPVGRVFEGQLIKAIETDSFIKINGRGRA